MRLAVSAAAMFCLSIAHANSPPTPPDGEAKWKAELVEDNDAYDKKPTAILKIDDAIYLKPGEMASLETLPDGGHRWNLNKPVNNGYSVSFSADSKWAMLGENGAPMPSQPTDLLKAKDPTALSATVRVTGGMAQIEPGKDGLRVAVYNDANPKAAAFTGLDYYPYDAGFVVHATFEPKTVLEPKTFQTSRGWYKQFYYAGDAVFTLKGKDVRLPMYAGTEKPGEVDSLAAFMMDDTTGKETYGVGRYVDVELAKGRLPDAITIDFNYLYNPNCARSPHYNCPVAVDRVALAVTAGEKKPAGHP